MPTAPHVLVAPDKFKGTLSAVEVAAHVAAGLRRAHPDLAIVPAPVADGGEGTVDAAVSAGFDRVVVETTGPLGGTRVQAAFAVRGTTAVVELAAAAGLGLLGERRAPLDATSFGAGELIRAALDRGAVEIVLGIGGSASTDGGAGMLQALGARLLDAEGVELLPGGATLRHLARVELGGLDPRLRDARITLASDVDNPLLGPQGAAAVYGPQKGATPSQVEMLDTALAHWAALVGADAAGRPGAGAAGGVGFAALAVLNARPRPGIEVVLELIDFPTLLVGAALVITGEGAIDEQTLHGKAPLGVASAARRAGVPVVAVCGVRRLPSESLAAAGFAATYALTDVEPDVGRCRATPGPLLEQLAGRIDLARIAR